MKRTLCLFLTLLTLLSAFPLSTFALMNHFLVKRAMRLKEAGKAG